MMRRRMLIKIPTLLLTWLDLIEELSQQYLGTLNRVSYIIFRNQLEDNACVLWIVGDVILLRCGGDLGMGAA